MNRGIKAEAHRGGQKVVASLTKPSPRTSTRHFLQPSDAMGAERDENDSLIGALRLLLAEKTMHLKEQESFICTQATCGLKRTIVLFI